MESFKELWRPLGRDDTMDLVYEVRDGEMFCKMNVVKTIEVPLGIRKVENVDVVVEPKRERSDSDFLYGDPEDNGVLGIYSQAATIEQLEQELDEQDYREGNNGQLDWNDLVLAKDYLDFIYIFKKAFPKDDRKLLTEVQFNSKGMIWIKSHLYQLMQNVRNGTLSYQWMRDTVRDVELEPQSGPLRKKEVLANLVTEHYTKEDLERIDEVVSWFLDLMLLPKALELFKRVMKPLLARKGKGSRPSKFMSAKNKSSADIYITKFSRESQKDYLEESSNVVDRVKSVGDQVSELNFKSTKTLSDFISEEQQKVYHRPPLFVLGRPIRNLQDAKEVEPLFSSDKGNYRKIVEFISQPYDLHSRNQLQGMIVRMFAKTKRFGQRNKKIEQLAKVDEVEEYPPLPSIREYDPKDFPDLPQYQSGNAEDAVNYAKGVGLITKGIVKTTSIESLKLFMGDSFDFQMGGFNFSRFAVFIIQVFRSDCNIVDSVLAAYNYFTGIQSIQCYVIELMNDAKSIFNVSDDDKVQYQASFASMVYEVWMNNPVLKAFWSLLTTLGLAHMLTESKMFSTGQIDFLKTKVVMNMDGKKGETMAEKFVSFFQVLIKQILACIKECSLAPLFGLYTDPADWQKRAHCLISHHNLIVLSPGSVNQAGWLDLKKRKVVPDSWCEQLTMPQLRDEVLTVIKQGEDLIKVSTDPVSVREISSTLARSRLLCEQLMGEQSLASSRIQPLGILCVGKPGVGKTLLMNSTFKSLGHLNGYDTTDCSNYAWQVGVNFQDGLNALQWSVVMDDTDADVSPPTRGAGNHALDVQNLVNNKPFPVEQAAVEQKGTVVARPLLVQYSSNFNDCRLNGYIADRGAFWRRLKIKVEVTAKPEFCDATGALSTKLVGDAVDIHDITVYEYDRSLYAATSENPPYRLVLKNISNREYYRWINAYFRAHVDLQKELLLKAAKDGEFCKHCGVVGCIDCVEYQCKTSTVLITAVGTAVAMRQAYLLRKYISAEFSNVNNLITDILVKRDLITKCCLNVKQLFKWTMPAMAVVLAIKTLSTCLSLYRSWMNGWTQFEPQFQSGKEDNIDERTKVDYVKMSDAFATSTPRDGAHSYEDVVTCIRKSTVGIMNEFGMRCFGLVVGVNCILINDHVIAGSTLTIRTEMCELVVKIDPLTYAKIGSTDSGILFVPGLPSGYSCLPEFWTSVDLSIVQFDEIHLIRKMDIVNLGKGKRDVQPPRPFDGNTNRMHGGQTISTVSQTVNGDCGYPYIAKFGSGWRIVGIHSMVLNGRSIAAAVDSLGVKPYISQLGLMLNDATYCVTQMSKRPEEQTFVQYQGLTKKSEVFYAFKRHHIGFFPIGRADPVVHGSSMKSKVHPTIYAREFSDLEEEVCGRKNYWQIPNFKGKMFEVEGDEPVWVSPFQHSYARISRDTTHVDMDLWWFAQMDYFSTIKSLDPQGYREISPKETMSGLPNSVIGPVNIKTSVGMPFNEPKKHHYYLKDGEWYLSHDVKPIHDELDTILSANQVPIPVCLCTLKDEAVKDEKNAKCNIRVFNAMSAAWNLKAKEYLAPHHAFFRSFPFALGILVGINMMSTESSTMIHQMEKINPKLDNILDTDMKSQDKAMGALNQMGVANTTWFISNHLGLAHKERARLIMEGNRSAVYICNNDFFQEGCQNPSGHNDTVETNSIDNNITDRYAYYKATGRVFTDEERQSIRAYVARFNVDPLSLPILSFTYLDNVCPATYGDDALRAFRSRFDLGLYVQGYKELGYELTDASKTATLTWKSLSDVTFLKRHFVYDEQLGLYLTPLEEKTIIRMLRLNKGSTLTDRDHDSIVLEEAMRELVYHGRDKFNFYREKFLEVKDKYELDHPYLKLEQYDAYYTMIQNGNFQTWFSVTAVDLIPQEVLTSSQYVYQSTKMTDVNLASPSGLNTAAVPVNAATSMEVHNTGDIQATNAMQKSDLSTTLRSLQSMPSNPLDQSLDRDVKIATYSLSSATSVGVVATLDPWALWQANSFVADKLRNYAYIKGNLVVTAVVIAQPGAYSMATLSFQPTGGPMPAGYQPVFAGTLARQQLMHVPHVNLDFALSNDGEVTLPIILPTEWASVSTTDGVYGLTGMYNGALYLWSTIGNAVGADVAATIQVYARLEGCELAVPTYQSSNVHKARDKINSKVKDKLGMKGSEFAKKAAGMAGSVAAAVPFLAPYAGPIAGGLASLGGVLDYFGFTRDTTIQSPQLVKVVGHSNIANVDGEDISEIAALYMNNTLSYNPTLSSGFGDFDPCSFEYLFQHWTYLDTITWAGTQATETVLKTYPVTPFQVVGNTSTGALELCPAGYVGLPFQFWRGDMEYLIMPLGSKFHRGSLQVSWNPGTIPVGDITNLNLNSIFSIAPGESHQFNIGFAMQQPASVRVLVSTATTEVYNSMNYNGRFTINVVNPLVATKGTGADTPSISILIFHRAAPNMRFGSPSPDLVLHANNTTYNLTLDNLQYQSGAVGDESDIMVKTHQLVPASTDYPFDKVLWGESFASVRPLLQKPQYLPMNSVDYTPNGQAYFQVPHVPRFVPIALNNNPASASGLPYHGEFEYTWHYLAPFVGVATSTRYKVKEMRENGTYPESIVSVTNFNAIKPFATVPSYFGTSYARMGLESYQQLTNGLTAEITVPYYNNLTYELINIVDASVASGGAPTFPSPYANYHYDSFKCTSNDIAANSVSALHVWRSCGPDVRVNAFRGIPTVNFSSTNSTAAWYWNYITGQT